VKCRHCGEFLNTGRAKALLRCATKGESLMRGNSGPDTGNQDSPEGPANPGEAVFAGRPTLWVIAGTLLKGGTLLAVAVLLMFWHIERIAWLKLSIEQAAVFGKYRLLLGLGIFLVVAAFLFYKALQIRMTHYEVSADRIEYGTGLLDRKVDNLDMFRVVDIKLRRSFLDCIVGVGTVMLTTTDKSHPEFTFEKVKHSRELYDTIKKASLSADRRTNVIHME
jgi:membrane protein YdbS with pleckstrin-like domain